jgi:predicted ArsR family transcriptional regulator
LAQFVLGETYPGPAIVDAMAEAFEGGISKDTARRYLTEWVKKGVFELVKKGKGTSPSLYRRTGKEPDAEG